jgi:hypothetical protein
MSKPPEILDIRSAGQGFEPECNRYRLKAKAQGLVTLGAVNLLRSIGSFHEGFEALPAEKAIPRVSCFEQPLQVRSLTQCSQ